MNIRDVLWSKMFKLFQSKGVKTIINHPINDVSQKGDSEYSSRVFEAIQIIHEIVSVKKQNLFLYCTSGVSRSATTIGAYLSIYKKVSQW
jgi:protein-tyrosine phosphatase